MAESEKHMDFSPQSRKSDGADLAAAVPRYMLYGDAADRPSWFVNIEPLDRRCRERGWAIAPHTHPRFTQILVCDAGGGTMTVDGETHAFGVGSVLVVPPFHVHAFQYSEASDGWVLTIENQYLAALLVRAPELRRLLETPGVFALAGISNDAVDDIATRLAAELQQNSPGSLIGAEIQLMSLLLLFLRHWPASEPAAAPQTVRAEIVRRFKEIVEQRYREQPLLPDIAAELGVSVSQLRLACKTVTGIAPIELLHDRTVAEAKRCLGYTAMSVAEIAEWLGFSDASYFSRFFTKAAGMAPTGYRRLHGSQAASAGRA